MKFFKKNKANTEASPNLKLSHKIVHPFKHVGYFLEGVGGCAAVIASSSLTAVFTIIFIPTIPITLVTSSIFPIIGRIFCSGVEGALDGTISLTTGIVHGTKNKFLKAFSSCTSTDDLTFFLNSIKKEHPIEATKNGAKGEWRRTKDLKPYLCLGAEYLKDKLGSSDKSGCFDLRYSYPE